MKRLKLYLITLVSLLLLSAKGPDAHSTGSHRVIPINRQFINAKLDLKKLIHSKDQKLKLNKVTLYIKTPYGLGQVQLQSGRVYSSAKRVDGSLDQYTQNKPDTFRKVVLENPNLNSQDLILHFKGEHQLSQIVLD